MYYTPPSILQSALITDKKAEEFRSKVHGAIRLLDMGQYALLGIGIVCILLAAVVFVYHKKVRTCNFAIVTDGV